MVNVTYDRAKQCLDCVLSCHTN